MSKQQNMAMVLQALKNAGMNDNQARIMGAEIGRENSFSDSLLWGYHTDPANKKLNVGMISWQGERGKGVVSALQNAGLIKDGKIVKGQKSLDVMAKYMLHEIRTNPRYARTKRMFLDNPNVSYDVGKEVLGNNYIVWAYTDKKYAKGHRNRDYFYKQLGGVVPKAGEAGEATQAPDQSTVLNALSSMANYQPTAQAQAQAQAQADYQPPQQAQTTDLFAGAGSSMFNLGLGFDLFTAIQGMGDKKLTQQLLTLSNL